MACQPDSFVNGGLTRVLEWHIYSAMANCRIFKIRIEEGLANAQNDFRGGYEREVTETGKANVSNTKIT
jgi:hypothetical protein